MHLSLHGPLLLTEVPQFLILIVVAGELLLLFGFLWLSVTVPRLTPFVTNYMLLDTFVCPRVPVVSVAIRYDHIRCVPTHL